MKLPYNFEPREYQLPLLDAVDSGYKRAFIVWHRRSGKEKVCLNLCFKKMFERVGTYYYFFPTYKQGRKILWNGIDRDGFAFMDHMPAKLIDTKTDQDMFMKTVNGSIFQVIGTDDIDRVVGTNPVGCVFSEYSLQNPAAWDYMRPILAENKGWAVFNTTPRGENHAFDLYNFAKDSKRWFCELLTVDDTKCIDFDVLRQEQKEIIAKDGDDALFQQEYYCKFSVPIRGAYYAKQIRKAEDEKRITDVAYESSLPVDTWWDLGVGDSTVMLFTQSVNNTIRIIDCYSNSGEGLQFYAKILSEKEYVYGIHNAPHDIKVRELGTGKSRMEIAKKLGINFKVVPKLDLDDGINAARGLFSKCWIDKTKCRDLIRALKHYHKEYDDKRRDFKNRPYHDWSSHFADAFRYLAVGYREKVDATAIKKQEKSVVNLRTNF